MDVSVPDGNNMETGTNSVNEKNIFYEFGELVEEGDTWYLLSTKWLEKWKNFNGIENDDSSGESQGPIENPGPIDNSGLLKEHSSELREHLVDKMEYELIPESAWRRLEGIYGLAEGQQAIARKAITTGSFSKQTTVEIYPPVISMKQYESDGQIIKEPFSRSSLISTVHEKMRELFDIPKNIKTKIFIEDSTDIVDESNTLDLASIGPTTTLVLEKQHSDGSWQRSTISPPTYKEAMSSSSSGASSSGASSSGASSSTPKQKTSYTNSYNNYGASSSYGTRSNSWWNSSREDQPGLCGLSNLGNTCFMNSAIQCLSNVPPLTMYFQDKTFKEELNRKNPIGMKGELAESYAALIHDIWSGKNSSVSPRDFKYKVSRFAPQFSGYQQHDSQELLAFLIDGLHEDLNRIIKKPYLELPDSHEKSDEEVAREAWENHLRRNNSVIVDMFHGLFKSTIVCPDCSRVSVTFDPFGFLSLPLPKARDMRTICNFVPRDPSKPVVRYNLLLPKDGSMKDLCNALAQKVGCQAKHLIVTDVYNHRFYKIYRGSEKLTSYSDRDNLFVYQLGFDDSDDDDEAKIEYARVYMRRGGQGSLVKRLFAHPFLIPVKSGTTTYRKFYNSVLAAVSRYVKKEFRDDVKMLSELRKCELNELMGSDVDGNETGDSAKEKTQENEEEEVQWFTIVQINPFGTTTIKGLVDDDKPIKFSNDMHFSAEWDTNVCDEYAIADWEKVFELDQSMSQQPVKEKGFTLQQCMKLFTTEERLGVHDEWYCPDCKNHKQATKKFDLWALPPILIIHLKRFSYSRWSRDKITTYVDFPIRDLDFSDFIINPGKNDWEPSKKKYNLIGVSNHYGGMGGGHYTAYAFNYREQKWHYFDDSSVSESSEDKVHTKAAYMLVYQRQDIEEWVKGGGKDQFNFLESVVSPRATHSEAFDFDGESTKQSQRKLIQNENDSLAYHNTDGSNIDTATPMDTD